MFVWFSFIFSNSVSPFIFSDLRKLNTATEHIIQLYLQAALLLLFCFAPHNIGPQFYCYFCSLWMELYIVVTSNCYTQNMTSCLSFKKHRMIEETHLARESCDLKLITAVL